MNRALLVGFWCCAGAFGAPSAKFDSDARRWLLRNEVMEASFQLGPAGTFEFRGMHYLTASQDWPAAKSVASAPIRLTLDQSSFDASTMYVLLKEWTSAAPRGGLRQNILLEESRGLGKVLVEIDLYSNLAVLRQGIRYFNTSGRAVHVTAASPVHWDLHAAAASYRALRVEQWMPMPGPNPADFQRILSNVDPGGRVLQTASGAHNHYCSWIAVNDASGQGIALGWEFDGRMTVDLRHQASEQTLQFSSRISGLYHPVPAGEEFQVPRAFAALYAGGPDDAGFVTQRFTEEVLAKPLPPGMPFPAVIWDSWAYGQGIDEETLRREAALAAKLGVEVFIVDLGWARALGDWTPDPVKFPGGMRGLSDYVHSLGMKFGIHFAWPEAAPDSPVLRQNPDWRSSVDYDYYGADSLCLAHEPVRQWIVAEAVRVIDETNADWILQDGENMVKECRKTTHTHHPLDSNYANAVDGLDWILKQVQAHRSHVLWENCENGGNMMTFQMVQNYATSILNDASGARAARQAAYGATFPFPSRYSDRYMPEQSMNAYTARSYLFGGPWILMNKLALLDAPDFEYLGREIARFKSIRETVRDGKILHVTNPPAEGRTDAIAAYDPATDSAVAVVTRDGAAAATFALRVGEFRRDKSYIVTFADDPRILTLTGEQIGRTGISVRLPERWGTEVVTITPAAADGRSRLQ
ncbi:MAG: alpha-galactosidase [Acidobacteria bacterium]|nr:alpha-galactosidase [Acidobacteriota bacterium]